MKYQSELIKEIVDKRGHMFPSLHYQSECVESWIKEVVGAYPKLCDYEGEWLNYIVESPIGEFPYVTLSDVTEATVNNVVPYAYKSAILSGSTKYRDIDTGEFLETFEEGRNLELVSVRMPVLKTYNKGFDENTHLQKAQIKVEDGIECYYLNGGFGILNSNTIVSNETYNFKENTQYTFKFTFKNSKTDSRSTARIFYTDDTYSNGTSLVANEWTEYSWTTRKDKTIKAITFDPGGYIQKGSIVLCEGTEIPANFDTYKSNILTVNEDVVLRAIGDVQDTLDCLTGEVVERVDEVVLDGSEKWIQWYGDDDRIGYKIDVGEKVINDGAILCDKFRTKTKGASYLSEMNSCFLDNTHIVFLLAKKDFSTIDYFKEWLSQNPITVQYQTTTESIKTVDLSVVNQDGETLSKIKPIEGTMHIYTSSDTIQPTFTVEIPVEAITQNLSSFIEE